jgi:steroid delta-isomerase-like uncharacterized protein
MSAEDNKAIAQRFFHALNDKNISAFDDLIAEDYIQHNPLVGQGREALKQFMPMYFAAFPDLRVSLEDLIADESKVVARWTMYGTHQGEFLGMPATGRKIEITGMDMWRVAGGKLAEHWDQLDNLGMMQQLGMIPTPGQ